MVVWPLEPSIRNHQSERRRRQDHHRHQPRGLPGGQRPQGPGHRLRSPGQRHHAASGVTKDPDRPSLYHVLLGETTSKTPSSPPSSKASPSSRPTKTWSAPTSNWSTCPPRIPPPGTPRPAPRAIPLHPDRLPARSRPADPQRPDRRRRRRRPHSVRVLRPGRHLRTHGHHRPDPRQLSATPSQIEGILLTMYDDRTNLTRQVARRPARIFPGPGLPHHHSPQHPPRRSAQFRQAHPVPTTRAPAAPKAISNSPKRSWTMNKAENPRKALGKGINALLPTRYHRAAAPELRPPSARTRKPRSHGHRPDPRQPAAAAPHLRTGRAERTGPVDPRQRHHSTARGPQGRRQR